MTYLSESFMFFIVLFNFTGIHHGTCAEIEKALNRELIHLPCRHHIFELVLKGVFEVYWPTSSGPNVQFFSRFKNKWNELDKSKFKAGIDDSLVNDVLSDSKQALLIFIEDNLQVCNHKFNLIKIIRAICY